jgi:voltage-gated potassium channel Kch
MNRKVSLGARLRYEFDKTMAAGPVALIGWLALVSLLIIIVAGVFLAVTTIAPPGSEPLSVGEGIWASLMRTLDAGTMGGDTGWAFRIVMLLVTLAGIFVVSALIGVLSSGIEGKLDELRKGRSQVLEADHTVILNWSPSIFDVISELTIANASRKRPRIVIMASKDKVEMEDEIADKIPDLRNTRVICRSGDPTDLYDLSIVNPQTSRAIIVLSPDGDEPDSQVVKTVLALTNDPRRRPEPYRIAAEIREMKNADLARVVGGSELQVVLADDFISRIVVHSSRQAGLSAVYSELLDFDGSEIYTVEQPALAGRSFGEILHAYPACAPIGVATPDGAVHLNPPMDTPLGRGMKLVLIAEDDDAIQAGRPPASIDASLIRDGETPPPGAERTLMLGWNRRAPIIAHELSRYVAPGSLLTIIADVPNLEAEVSALTTATDHLRVEWCAADSSSRAVLDGFDVPSYDHVLVLGYIGHLPPQPADTRTLVTLLHLRKIAETAGRHINVVSEMVDVRNRELAEVSRADDFVVSNKLVSLMLAQAAENESMAAIFGSLLDEQGSELYLRPMSDYVALGVPVDFHVVVESARRRGEVAIGYRRAGAGDADGRNMAGVVINPPKATAVAFQPGDSIVVLAR